MRVKNLIQKISAWIPAINAFLSTMVYLSVQSDVQVVGAAGSTIYKKVGDSVQFPFTPVKDHDYKVELKYNSSAVVLWLPQLSPQILDIQYYGRVEIKDNIICLQKLDLSDSGTYDLHVGYFSEPHIHSEKFHLNIVEPVSKPNITAECQSSNFTLSCSSGQGSDVEYSWEILSPHGNSSFVQQGSVIQIDKAAGLEQPKYKCTAQNKISRETSDPLDLGVCIHNTPGWIPALSVVSPFFLIGALIYKYKRRRRRKHVPDTEIPHSAPDEMSLPFHIEPVYVREL